MTEFGFAILFGGILGGIMYFFFFPSMLWLAALTGFSGGYLAYVRKEMIEKAPGVWHSTCESFGIGGSKTVGALKYGVLWVRRNYVLILPVIIVVLMINFTILSLAELMDGRGINESFESFINAATNAGKLIVLFLMFFFYVIIIVILSIIAVSMLIDSGLRRDNCFIVPVGESLEDGRYYRLRAIGQKEAFLTHTNVFRWVFLEGIFSKAGKVLLTIPRGLGCAIKLLVALLAVISLFLISLFLIVHTRRAVLAGIFAATGVIIGAIALGTESLVFAQKVVGVMLCGISGMAIGLLYENTVAMTIRRTFNLQTNGA